MPETYASRLTTTGARAAATRDLVDLFNGEFADEIVAKIISLDRLDVVAKGTVANKWGSKTARSYLDQVEALGKNNTAVLRFDQFADVSGSNRLLKVGIENSGVQAELRAAEVLRMELGEDLLEFRKKIDGTLDGNPVKGDADLLFSSSVVEVKSGNLANEVKNLTVEGGELDKLVLSILWTLLSRS